MKHEMKNTGITRRIDELGRVVIPKELREIHRLKVGTPMLISVQGDSLLLTKFSNLSIMEDSARVVAESLHDATSLNVLLCDDSKVVAAWGDERSCFDGRIGLTDEYSKIVDSRRHFASNERNMFNKTFGFGGDDEFEFAIQPLKQNGDILGSLALFGSKIDAVHTELLKFAAAVIEKQFN